jgi:hypothetical protein
MGTAAAGGALLAGCGRAQSEHAGAADVDPTEPAVDADSDLVATIGGQIAHALAVVVATGSAVPGLRPLTRRLTALHRSHLGELSRPRRAGHGGKVAESPEAARTELLRSEEKLQRQLVQAALDAESGALAQVLASMAAAVAQELAVEG